jgi:hypothetical protein
MSSSRAKALKEKNVVVSLVKDLNKRMSDFEDSVSDLKILKDSILEMNDEILRQESENTSELLKLKNNLIENKTKILKDTAAEIGKVLISQDELNELRNEVTKFKNEAVSMKNNMDKLIKEKVTEEVVNKLKFQKMENEIETAQLVAATDNYKVQIESLNQTIERMSKELDSQKDLTASVCNVSKTRNFTETK